MTNNGPARRCPSALDLSAAATRRRFLQSAGAFAAAIAIDPLRLLAADKDRPLKVAAIFTAMEHRWHAHVILENFLEPYLFNGELTSPGMEVASFYADQFPANDLARPVAKEYGIPLYPTIAEALRLGGDDLAVDAVLLIGEHGDYPVDEHGVKQYPRKRLFDECVAVFRQSQRVVPVFSDKHLSYRWDWAKEMYDVAREMKIPLMAGSSVPLAERRPPLELPDDARIEQAVSIHGGPFEMYDIHGLEVLQSMIETRGGGERGVKSVQFLDEDALWKAADDGAWSPELADAAMAAELGPDQPPLRELRKTEAFRGSLPHGILLEYVDGLRGIVLKLGQSGIRWNFACRLKDKPQPVATSFYVGPWQNRNLFKALSHAIQTHFREGEAPYPVERTLLTTGIVCAAVNSFAQKGVKLETPHLQIAYAPKDCRAMREMGRTWQILTEETPEPFGFTRGGHRGGSTLPSSVSN